ncbi:MAG: type III pantothenate kinase [Micavibrio sp.]|nr:type III pantothenate kinase [Micavibrio sp.]
MLLAIDVGNTNTVFAVYDAEQLVNNWRLRTEPARSSDEYAVFLSRMFELSGVSLASISDVIISSVVPETEFSLGRFCSKQLGCEPTYVTKDMVDVRIDLERPEDVGADRLVNAMAVVAEYSMPAVVIDFGTATTFDVVDAEGAYIGGVIAPGVNLSLNALHSAASKLPKVNIEKVDRVIGKTTVQAMKSGLFWGYVSMIDGVLERIEKELGDKPYVLATGGLAGLFSENIAAIDSVDEQLTLKGLYEIFKNMKVK